MVAYVLDWANLLLRLAHGITAVARIVSSCCFVYRDNRLTKPESPNLLANGVEGALCKAVVDTRCTACQNALVASKNLARQTSRWMSRARADKALVRGATHRAIEAKNSFNKPWMQRR